MKEIKDQIKKYLYSVNAKRTNGNKLTVEGMEVTPTRGVDIINSVGRRTVGLDDIWSDLKPSIQKGYATTAFNEVILELRHNSLKNKFNGDIPDFTSDIWESLYPVRDMDNDLDLIYDSAKDRLHKMTYAAYLKLCPKNFREGLSKPCASVYHPLDTHKSWIAPYDDGEEVLHINRYNHPKWRQERTTTKGCPLIVDKFFKHLIPDETGRRFMLNWVRNALVTEGNGTYLVFNAAKGVGKNLFASIVAGLVGQSHYDKANRRFLSKEFNSILKDKRLILIDEQPMNTNGIMDQAKDFINKEQNIEAKGVDANKTIRTYNSFIICNNRETDMKLEQDDRRFSVMDTTSTNLKDVFTLEEIITIDNVSKNPEMLAQLGWWILDECECPEWSTETAWKGPRFDHLVKTSLWEWNLFIIDTIESNEEIEYEFIALTKKYKSVRTSTKSSFTKTKLNEFLTAYKHEGHKLGELVKRGKESYLIPSKYFQNVDKEEVKPIEEIDEDIL